MLHLRWNSDKEDREAFGRGLRDLFPVEPIPPDFLTILQALDAKLEHRQPAREREEAAFSRSGRK